jgi:BON domain
VADLRDTGVVTGGSGAPFAEAAANVARRCHPPVRSATDTTYAPRRAAMMYTDDFLSRYAPGGVHGVLRVLRDQRLFPGMQPIGVYPIHIVVKNGRTMLLGAVDSAADRQIAEVRAREVTGVFEVQNSLTVAR